MDFFLAKLTALGSFPFFIPSKKEASYPRFISRERSRLFPTSLTLMLLTAAVLWDNEKSQLKYHCNNYYADTKIIILLSCNEKMSNMGILIPIRLAFLQTFLSLSYTCRISMANTNFVFSNVFIFLFLIQKKWNGFSKQNAL